MLFTLLFAGTVNADSKEMYGRLVGTIAGVTFDEPIACLGQNERPEAFFQEHPPVAHDAPGGVKVSGGASGKTLTLLVRGKGLDERLMLRDVQFVAGKYVYVGTVIKRNKPDVEIDIKLWCSPELPPTDTEKASVEEVTSSAVPYAVRQFESVGTGAIDTGDTSYAFQVADCNLQPKDQGNGWTREFYILGAGVSNGRDFFVRIQQSRKGSKTTSDSMIRFAPLPQVMTIEDMDAFLYLQGADGINLMPGNKHSGRRLLLEDNKVVSESKVGLLYTGEGFTSKERTNPLKASVVVHCG